MIAVDTCKDYKSLSLFPYITIDWSEDSKERGCKTCISIGWLFWEFYIDFV